MIDLTLTQKFFKRTFDIVLSLLLVVVFIIPIILLIIVATFETRSFGLFRQLRIGLYGKKFYVLKIKTMYDGTSISSITCSSDTNITLIGSYMRKYKLDELPQLINILIGDMSFVGPRPDVPGYADNLVGINRSILNIRPGITGPASLKYKNEEFILSQKDDPKSYNDFVIWPDKVHINLNYIKDYKFSNDIIYILKTL